MSVISCGLPMSRNAVSSAVSSGVSARARRARLREELAGRHAEKPTALAAKMRLVGVPGLDGPPCEIAVCRTLASQLLRADADRCPAPAPQPAFGDGQQSWQRSWTAAVPRYEAPDRLAPSGSAAPAD
jgi:hypothetical protein